MNDPGRTGAATYTASHDAAGGDVGLDDTAVLGRIGRGDEDAMSGFYREHGRVVLAQVLLVTGERALAEGDLAGHDARRLAGRGLLPGARRGPG